MRCHEVFGVTRLAIHQTTSDGQLRHVAGAVVLQPGELPRSETKRSCGRWNRAKLLGVGDDHVDQNYPQRQLCEGLGRCFSLLVASERQHGEMIDLVWKLIYISLQYNRRRRTCSFEIIHCG